MTSRPGAVLSGVLRTQRRTIALWAVAVAAVSALYTAFYPSVGAEKFEVMMQSMPPELVTAMGFDSIATAAGYVSSTVYALLGAILVLVCAVGTGARLVAGQEEDGTLELELTGPVSRIRVYAERLAALWLTVLALVVAVTLTLLLLSAALDLGLSVVNLLAAGSGLLLFGGALGTVAFAVGAATGRRAAGLGAAALLAVLAYVLGYLGPLVGASWMQRVSPYDWYIGAEPLLTGFDTGGLALLAALAVAAALVGGAAFRSRDLMA
jgi:ABC-2 type transport system permease protein